MMHTKMYKLIVIHTATEIYRRVESGEGHKQLREGL